MNISVVGTGYVGLVTGTVFADLGNDVICVDTDSEKIKMLEAGKMPIYEPGLEEMVQRNHEDGRLSFSTDIGDAVKKSDVIFIAVGTPQKENGETDLSYVVNVAKEIAEHIDSYKIVVNKSTVPVGTGDLVFDVIERNKKLDVDFDVVSNPEFLREGTAINDTLYPDRIIIGAPNKNVALKLLELYASLEKPMLITDIYSAEVIKYASNAFLATKISFINAISNLCEKVGADVVQVSKGVGYDKRIGSDFLNAGLGYGGSCFPKDVKSLIHTATKFDCDIDIIKAVEKINDGRVPNFIQNIRNIFPGVKGKVFCILGVSFKPDTDDMREAKSLEIIKALLADGAIIKVYDPVAMEEAKAIVPEIECCKNAYEAAEGASAVVVVTEWREFKFLNLEKLLTKMKEPVMFDGRNLYSAERMKKIGFRYYGIGRCSE